MNFPIVVKCHSLAYFPYVAETGYKLTFTKSHRNTDVQRVLTDVKQVLKANERVFITSNLGYEFCINIGFPENQLLIDLFKHLEMVKDNLEVSTTGAISIIRFPIAISRNHFVSCRC